MGERTESLKAVTVAMGETWGYSFHVDVAGVTKIDWGERRGTGGYLDTVRVWTNGEVSHEFPFCNCVGVEFARAQGKG